MKKFHFSLALMLFVVGCDAAPLKMKGVKNSYGAGEAVVFILENSSAKKMWYGIGVEKGMNGKWVEIISDLNANSDLDPVGFNQIGPKEVRALEWDAKKIEKVMGYNKGYYRRLPGKCRFVVRWLGYTDQVKADFYKMASKVYSSEFEIK